jgi:hypothetical protein
MINLHAGTLDDPSLVAPTLEIYCDSCAILLNFGALVRYCRDGG